VCRRFSTPAHLRTLRQVFEPVRRVSRGIAFECRERHESRSLVRVYATTHFSAGQGD
jgi:hypothetical protein